LFICGNSWVTGAALRAPVSSSKGFLKCSNALVSVGHWSPRLYRRCRTSRSRGRRGTPVRRKNLTADNARTGSTHAAAPLTATRSSAPKTAPPAWPPGPCSTTPTTQSWAQRVDRGPSCWIPATAL